MTITTSTTSKATARPIWKAAAMSGVLAALTTASVAAIADSAGISLDVDGDPIPAAGFSTMTLAAVVVGYVLAIALNRWAVHPRRTFTVTALVLTAASFIPDLTFPMSATTSALLITTHILAAAIVIPSIAARLPETR